MTKVMVVEDDQSLREIYSIRLTAEGYEVVSAGYGEEALAVAVKEKPDLIVSDVMMPKISGFDMLDILRSTPETKDVKVIMMTALSSDDQRKRGENLGADRYLVKSQVGIEDVINAVKEVLSGKPAAAAVAPGISVATTPATPNVPASPAPTPAPMNPAQPTAASMPAPAQAAPAPTPVNGAPAPAPTNPTPAPVPQTQTLTPSPVNPVTPAPVPNAPTPVAPQPAPTPAQAPVSPAPAPVTPIPPAPAIPTQTPQVPNNGQPLPTNPAQ